MSSPWRTSNTNHGNGTFTPLSDLEEGSKWLPRFWTRMDAMRRNNWVVGIAVLLILIMLFCVGVVIHQEQSQAQAAKKRAETCDGSCQYQLVESIPYGINQTLHTNVSIAQAYLDIINGAKKSLDIACFYMTFNQHGPEGTGSQEGRAVYQALVDAAKRGVSIRIAISQSIDNNQPDDARALADAGYASVRVVDMPKFYPTHSGVLHTKFILADNSSMYVGSANMDWRSLTQVKELGVYITSCSCLARDLYKVFAMYYEAGAVTSLPSVWPQSMEPLHNQSNPWSMQLDDQTGSVYFSSSPKNLCPMGRTFDLDAMVDTINNAASFVKMEVMDYSPSVLYSTPQYFPPIDDAIRSAALRGIKVQMLIGFWNHTRADQIMYLRSLNVLDNVDVRLFVVPPDPTGAAVPFTRVNHAKFQVTDSHAYVGTSNWSGDYYIDTAGVAFVSTHPNVRNDVQNAFDRDWASPFSHALNATWPVVQ